MHTFADALRSAADAEDLSMELQLFALSPVTNGHNTALQECSHNSNKDLTCTPRWWCAASAHRDCGAGRSVPRNDVDIAWLHSEADSTSRMHGLVLQGGDTCTKDWRQHAMSVAGGCAAAGCAGGCCCSSEECGAAGLGVDGLVVQRGDTCDFSRTHGRS